MKENYKNAPEWIEFVKDNFPSARIMLNGLALWGEATANAVSMSNRFSEVSPYISQAMDVAIKNELTAGIYFMPACVFDPYYWNYFGFKFYDEAVVEGRDSGIIAKSSNLNSCYDLPPQCSSCLMSSRCVWSWEPYKDIYGLSELEPAVANCA